MELRAAAMAADFQFDSIVQSFLLHVQDQKNFHTFLWKAIKKHPNSTQNSRVNFFIRSTVLMSDTRFK